MGEEYSSLEICDRLYALTLRSPAWEEPLEQVGPWEKIDQDCLDGIWEEIQAQVVDPMKALKALHSKLYKNEYIKRVLLRDTPTRMLTLMGINIPANVSENSSELEAWWFKDERTDCKNIDRKTLSILDAAVASGNNADMNVALISVLGSFLTSDTFCIQRDAALELGDIVGVRCPELRD